MRSAIAFKTLMRDIFHADILRDLNCWDNAAPMIKRCAWATRRH